MPFLPPIQFIIVGLLTSMIGHLPLIRAANSTPLEYSSLMRSFESLYRDITRVGNATWPTATTNDITMMQAIPIDSTTPAILVAKRDNTGHRNKKSRPSTKSKSSTKKTKHHKRSLTPRHKATGPMRMNQFVHHMLMKTDLFDDQARASAKEITHIIDANAAVCKESISCWKEHFMKEASKHLRVVASHLRPDTHDRFIKEAKRLLKKGSKRTTTTKKRGRKQQHSRHKRGGGDGATTTVMSSEKRARLIHEQEADIARLQRMLQQMESSLEL